MEVFILYTLLCVWNGLEWVRSVPSIEIMSLFPNFEFFWSLLIAHFSENWGYLGISLLVGGNIFSLVFGQNLDAHHHHHLSTTTTTSTIISHLDNLNRLHHPSPSSPPPPLSSSSTVNNPVQCMKGLDCYASAIYLTLSATLFSVLLCVWAGYREKQRMERKLLK